MMKVLGLCLVLTSLADAGFFTPSPEKHNSKDDVTVREGHAPGVVIEFEKDDGNTKVSVSPKDIDEKGYVANGKEEKLSERMEEAKEKIKEATSSVQSQAKKDGKEAKETTASDAVGKVQDTVTQSAQNASDKAKESVRDAASGVSSKVTEMKQGAKEQAERAKQQVYDAFDEAKEDAERKGQTWVGSGSDQVKKEGHKGVKGFLRRAAGVVFKYVVVSPVRMGSLLHLLGFAVAYGMSVWVTFASSYVMAGALPRHQFAMVQSKIYPVYFKAMAGSVVLALLGYLMSRISVLGGFNLMASLAMILVNMLYLERRTTKVMFERMKKEKEEGTGKEGHVTEPAVELTTETGRSASSTATGGVTTRHEATKEEKREEATAAAKPRMREILVRGLNSNSSLLNVVTLMSLTCHLVHLAQHLHAVC